MAIYTSILTGGSNDHETTSEEVNAFASDFANEGVIGTIANTGGVAPATGSFAVNAQGTPDATVAVTAGTAYVTATPTSQNSQTLRVRSTGTENVTISANSSGSTKYDWIYISISAANAANPAVAGDNVATLVASRSTSATSDDGTPPTYGYPLAVVTVANGFSTITNGNIQDIRSQVVLNQGLNSGTDGWTNAGETWTYASATTFTVAGVDVTAKYPVGTKIKLTQTTTKYFYVTGASFSTNTTVTVTGGTSYTLANAAIVNPYYSYAATPQGHPLTFTYAPTPTGYSANPTNFAYTFSMNGKLVRVELSETTNGTSNATTKTYPLPVTARTLTNREWDSPAFIVNSGSSAAPVLARVSSGATSVSIFATATGGAWTASGNARVVNSTITYEAAS